MDKSLEFEYVGFWKRILTAIIDIAVAFVIFIITARLVAYANEMKTIIPLLIRDLLYVGFWVIIVKKLGGTPGELILQMRVTFIFPIMERFYSIRKSVLFMILSLAVL